MLFEHGDFDFLFFKDEDHTITLSFQFLCDMSMWRLQFHYGSFGFPFHLSLFCWCFLRKQAKPKQENAAPVGNPLLLVCKEEVNQVQKVSMWTIEGSEAVKESPTAQGKADWPGLIQEKM